MDIPLDRRAVLGTRNRQVVGGLQVEPRARISAQMTRGWLAFEAADGERRRLAPIPNGWADGSTEQLRGWCANAEAAPPVRRLIE